MSSSREQTFAHDWARCESSLLESGFDLTHAFSVEALNSMVAPEHRLPLHSRSTGLLIGNSKKLWDPFLQSLSEADESAWSDSPLDAYVEQKVRAALEACAPILYLRFAHEMLPAPVPIQRYADVTGLAQLGPAGLSIHPEFGPWFALRAVAVIGHPTTSLPQPRKEVRPCAGCSAPCKEPFDEALKLLVVDKAAPLPSASRENSLGLSTLGQKWLAVRQACPWGRSEQYCAKQILYHYDKDRSALKIVG